MTDVERRNYAYGPVDGYPTHSWELGVFEENGTMGFARVIQPGELVELKVIRKVNGVPAIAGSLVTRADVDRLLATAPVIEEPELFRPRAGAMAAGGKFGVFLIPGGWRDHHESFVLIDQAWGADPDEWLRCGIWLSRDEFHRLLQARSLE